MNIPPLISRTPPPINDVIDDEDEEDDEDVSIFHNLNFFDPKSCKNSPGEHEVVGCQGDIDLKEDLNIKKCNQHFNTDLSQLPDAEIRESALFSSLILEDSSKVNHHVFSDETGCNGIISSQHDVSSNSPITEKTENSIIKETLYGELKDYCKESPSFSDDQSRSANDDDDGDNEDSSHVGKEKFLSKEKNIREGVLDEMDTDSTTLHNIISETNQCPKSTEDVTTYEPESKSGNPKDAEVSVIEKNEIEQDILVSDSIFIKNGILNCDLKKVDKNSVVENETEFGEYKFESAVVSSSIVNTNQDQSSSQFIPGFEFNNLNSQVTEESEIPAAETNDSKILTEKSLESTLNSVELEIPSEDKKNYSIAPSEPIPAEFSATFPDIVENYQSSSDLCEDDEFSDFVECIYEPCSILEKKTQLTEPYHIFAESLVESEVPPVLLLCLKEELRKTSVWNELSCLENSPALNYKWGNSYSSSRLLSALKIDSRNILTGQWPKSIRKLPSDDFKSGSELRDSNLEITLHKATVPRPQFEWVGSGLINPLDDGVTRVKKSSITTLSVEAEKLISSFPDLSYLKRSFIVFPKSIN